MGRFYSGQISGKFWFGVQSSTDASYFGVEPTDIVNYHVCNCTYEECGTDPNYCTSCYSSYEEHIQSMIDEDIDLEEESLESSSKCLDVGLHLPCIPKPPINFIRSKFSHIFVHNAKFVIALMAESLIKHTNIAFNCLIWIGNAMIC